MSCTRTLKTLMPKRPRVAATSGCATSVCFTWPSFVNIMLAVWATKLATWDGPSIARERSGALVDTFASPTKRAQRSLKALMLHKLQSLQ